MKPVKQRGDRLGYVHIGESHRGYLGTGTIDFDAFFGALLTSGYDGDDLARHAYEFMAKRLVPAGVR